MLIDKLKFDILCFLFDCDCSPDTRLFIMLNTENTRSTAVIGRLPSGAIVDSEWMDRHSISRSTRSYYAQNGTFAKLGRGLYAKRSEELRETSELSWMRVVGSLAQVMKANFHIGGETALKIKAILHRLEYVDEVPIILYGKEFPSWLSTVDTDRQITTLGTDLFTNEEVGLTYTVIRCFNSTAESLCSISTEERAMLEAIEEARRQNSLDQFEFRFRQWSVMRSRVLKALFAQCRSPTAVKFLRQYGRNLNCEWSRELDQQGGVLA